MNLSSTTSARIGSLSAHSARFTSLGFIPLCIFCGLPGEEEDRLASNELKPGKLNSAYVGSPAILPSILMPSPPLTLPCYYYSSIALLAS
jgi:hypothetical protein